MNKSFLGRISAQKAHALLLSKAKNSYNNPQLYRNVR